MFEPCKAGPRKNHGHRLRNQKHLFKATAKDCDGFAVKPVRKDTLEEEIASMGLA